MRGDLQKSRRERYAVRSDVSHVKKRMQVIAGAPNGGRRFCAADPEQPKAAEDCAGRIHFGRALGSLKGGGGSQPPGPKKKDILLDVLPFCHVLRKKMRAAAGAPHGGAALLRRKFGAAKGGGELRRANLLRPSILIFRGHQNERHDLWSCLSFW